MVRQVQEIKTFGDLKEYMVSRDISIGMNYQGGVFKVVFYSSYQGGKIFLISFQDVDLSIAINKAVDYIEGRLS